MEEQDPTPEEDQDPELVKTRGLIHVQDREQEDHLTTGGSQDQVAKLEAWKWMDTEVSQIATSSTPRASSSNTGIISSSICLHKTRTGSKTQEITMTDMTNNTDRTLRCNRNQTGIKSTLKDTDHNTLSNNTLSKITIISKCAKFTALLASASSKCTTRSNITIKIFTLSNKCLKITF